jgi:predicted Zn-dependent protease with MMP-like domain
MSRHYERFMRRVKRGESGEAIEEFARMCRSIRSSDLKLSSRVLAGLTEGWIDLFWQARRHDTMLKIARDAEKMFGEDPEWSFAQGEALFNMGRFEEARSMLEPLTTEDFDEPMLYYLLACLAERRGEDEDAHRLFQAAHRLSPSGFDVPESLGHEEILAIYEQCLADLPDPILWHLKSVRVEVGELPSDEFILSTDPPLDPLILGLFVQASDLNPPHAGAKDEPIVLLFAKNIAKVTPDPETLEEDLRKTLFHTVGQALGFTEDQLEEMGLA